MSSEAAASGAGWEATVDRAATAINPLSAHDQFDSADGVVGTHPLRIWTPRPHRSDLRLSPSSLLARPSQLTSRAAIKIILQNGTPQKKQFKVDGQSDLNPSRGGGEVKVGANQPGR